MHDALRLAGDELVHIVLVVRPDDLVVVVDDEALVLRHEFVLRHASAIVRHRRTSFLVLVLPRRSMQFLDSLQ